ncbi:MAG: anti-sigma factor [Pirellulaceae bacterium]
MKCAEVQDILVEFVLDELDATERQEVQQHLASNCECCQQHLAELVEGVGLLFEIAPTAELRADRAAAILSRARASQAAAPLGRDWLTLPASLLALAAGLFIAATIWPATPIGGGGSTSVRQESAKRANEVGEGTPSSEHRLGDFQDLARRLHLPSQTSYQTTFVASRAMPGSTGLQGLVICDLLARELHFFGRSFPPAPAGRDYVLWIGGISVPAQPLATLTVGVDGNCRSVVPLPDGDFEGVFVTLEPSGDPPSKPSGDAQLTF